MSAAQTQQLADELGLVLLEKGESRIAISPARWRIFTASLMEQLGAFHAENPDLQGIGREKLRLLLQPRLPAPAFVIALQKAAQNGELVLDGAFVRLATHAARFAPEDEAAWGVIAPLLGGARSVPAAARARHRGGDAGGPNAMSGGCSSSPGG